MILYFVRHTENDNPEKVYAFHLPLHLSNAGRKHAERIEKWFSKKQIRSPIYPSPIARATETAEIIASQTTQRYTQIQD